MLGHNQVLPRLIFISLGDMEQKQVIMMELQHIKSRFWKKNAHQKQVTEIPISSTDYALSIKGSSKTLLHDPSIQYQLQPSPANHYSKVRHCRGDSMLAKMIRLGETMDIFAQGIREHLRLGPKLSETVKGKLSLGARIIQVGGVEKVFKQKFKVRDDERLLKALQCYLSTTAGPIAGLLFVSNNRVAFCSERSIKFSSATGKLQKLHYKVMIPLEKIDRVHESANSKKSMHKYVQIVTEDNYDFWFMGFLNQKKTLKCLHQAIKQARDDLMEIHDFRM